MSKPRRTEKQKIVMKIILDAAQRGEFLNVTEIHAALPYVCHYGSLRGTLDFLESHGVIVKERAGMSRLVKPTSLAYAWFAGRG